MSLIAFAVRVCTVQALLGETLAGVSVEDAPIDPVSIALAATTPYIAVFTDAENNKPDARSTIEGEHVQDLTLYVFLPAALKLTVGDVTYDFQARDSAASLVIDLIQRQIERVLMSGQSVWAQLWRRFVTSIKEVDARAYVLDTGTGTGVRVPAREVVLRCETLFNPPFGTVPSGPWADLITALEAGTDTQGLGPLVAYAITGDALQPWQQDEAELGYTGTDMADIGLGPIDSDPASDGIPISEIALADETQPNVPPLTTSNPVAAP